MQEDAAERALQLARVYSRRSTETVDACATSEDDDRRPGSRSRRLSRRSTAAATPVKRTVGDAVDVSARRSSATATSSSAPRCATGRRARPLARGAAGARRQRPLGGLVHADALGRWQFRDRGVGRPLRVAGTTSSAARSTAGQEDLASELAEGARAARRRRADRRGGARVDGRRPLGEDVVADARGRRRPRARALRRLVRAVPALVGRLRGRARSCCRGSPSSASTSSTCRRSTRSARRTARAATTRSTAGPERSRQPVGDRLARRAATTRSTRSSARSRSSTRLVARREGAGIEIALDFAIQCSPDHPWLKEHPEWFHRRPDGTLKYAENPPKSYQDIYNVNFDSRGLEGSLGRRCATSSCSGSRAASRVFRVDNPHTKPVPFWEWLIDEVRARASGGDLPRRGVHAAGDDDDAREGRLRAELHVLHVEEHALGAARVHGAARSSGAEFYRPNFFANTPDILHEYLQPAAGPRSRRGSCSRRRSRRRTASTPATSSFENVPVRDGLRGVPRLGEVRGEAAHARRAAAAARRSG